MHTRSKIPPTLPWEPDDSSARSEQHVISYKPLSSGDKTVGVNVSTALVYIHQNLHPLTLVAKAVELISHLSSSLFSPVQYLQVTP